MKDNFKKLGFTPSLLQARAEQQLRGMELQEKGREKGKKDTDSCLETTSGKKVLVNCRFTAI